MSLLNSFPHRCTIQRMVRSSGSLAGSKTTPVIEQTNVSCWEQPAGDAEVEEYQKRGMKVTHKIYFTVDPGVTERYQILITERSGIAVASPIALDVKSEPRPDATAGLGVVYKVMCDLLTGSND